MRFIIPTLCIALGDLDCIFTGKAIMSGQKKQVIEKRYPLEEESIKQSRIQPRCSSY
jgi:hypothetical protein